MTDHFAFYRGADIDQIAAPRKLVRGWLNIKTVAMMIAPSEAGKSTITTDITCKVAQHYPAIYVAAEDGANVRTQIRAWELTHNRERSQNLILHDGPVALADDAAVTQFIAITRLMEPRLVVFDTLSACIPGVDENSSDMTQVTHNLSRIAAELDAAVLVLHHPLKYDGGTFRGHSSLMNNTHTLLVVAREPGDDIVTLTVTRHKGPRANPIAIKLVVRPTDIADPDDGLLSAPVALPATRVMQDPAHLSARQKAILHYLSDLDADDGATASDIAREIATQFKATEGRVRTDIASLVKRGLMTRGDKQRDPRRITDKGRQAIEADQVRSSDQVAPAEPFEINTRLAEAATQTTNPIASHSCDTAHADAQTQNLIAPDRNLIAPDRDQVLTPDDLPDRLIDSFRIDQAIKSGEPIAHTMDSANYNGTATIGRLGERSRRAALAAEYERLIGPLVETLTIDELESKLAEVR